MSSKAGEKFFIERFIVGPLSTNAYLLADPKTKAACLIDPGSDGKRIKDFITRNGFDLKFIINTHGHGDHIAANGFFGVPIYIHALDKDFLTDAGKNGSRLMFLNIKSPPASKLFEDGDTIKLGPININILHTPGHTPGSVSLKLDGVVFTGDTLFNMSIGRSDFDYGDGEALLKGIRQKLFVLDDDTVIYPGHGDSSTIGEEKRGNPFLQ